MLDTQIEHFPTDGSVARADGTPTPTLTSICQQHNWLGLWPAANICAGQDDVAGVCMMHPLHATPHLVDCAKGNGFLAIRCRDYHCAPGQATVQGRDNLA